MANKITYCLWGVAGFVARRHVEAIYKTGGELIGVMDPFDCVGFLDSFDKGIEFFTDEEEFKGFCIQNKPDYVVICTPNYLHKEQCLFGLSIGSDIICEKPLVLSPSHLGELVDVELSTGRKINTILQLRLNPVLQGLRCEVEGSKKYHEVEILYQTPRGRWYSKSWKADEERSGGIATNIGIHLFDLCQWIWGSVQDIQLKTKTTTSVIGDLFLEKAHITFNLGIEGVASNRSLKIGKRKIEFSKGFVSAHTLSYQKILVGKGFGLVDALPSIVLCDQIRKLVVN